MLDENSHLIQSIQEFQSKGKISECMQYQQILHRNLVYLASIADANQNIQALLPVSTHVMIQILVELEYELNFNLIVDMI